MFTTWRELCAHKRTPNFENLLAVLRRAVPPRPVLYELFMNDVVYVCAAAEGADLNTPQARAVTTIRAFAALGYDYANPWGMYTFAFPATDKHKASTISLNDAPMITDRASFEAYPWPMPERAQVLPDQFFLEILPPGMKLVPLSPGGVLETLIKLVGYDNLCFLLADDPELVQNIVDAIGLRLLRLYEILLSYQSVGAIVANDDWGFKTQTMLSVAQMRKYIFPWHTKIVACAHAHGKPVILHSCGNPREIMDDVIDDIRFDARHSYEDNIVPVEEAYDQWGRRIATMGGIDVDFLCRSTPEQVYARSRAMLERAAKRGGYALGSGNSIPEFVPQANYLAMVSAAWEF
jgi:uroporphyrinogen decarboxylase